MSREIMRFDLICIELGNCQGYFLLCWLFNNIRGPLRVNIKTFALEKDTFRKWLKKRQIKKKTDLTIL